MVLAFFVCLHDFKFFAYINLVLHINYLDNIKNKIYI